MKRLLSTILVVIFTLSITAQVWNTDTKMSPWLHAKYSQEMQEVKKNGGPKRVQGRTVRNYILALVKNSDEAAAVREAGGVVLQDFGNDVCAAFLPIDKLGELDNSPSPNSPAPTRTSTTAGERLMPMPDCSTS